MIFYLFAIIGTYKFVIFAQIKAQMVAYDALLLVKSEPIHRKKR